MGEKSVPDKFGSRMPQVRILSLGPPFLEKPPKKAVFLRYKFNFRSALGHMLIVVRAVKWPLRLRYRVTLKTTKSLTHP